MKHIMSRYTSLSRIVPGGARALLAVLGWTLACEQYPGAPDEIVRSGLQSKAVNFVDSPIDSPIDSPLHGLEAQLSGFDGVSELAYNTATGSSIATLTNNTIYRAANLNQFTPVDPCRQYAIDYNTAGASGDAAGIFSAISAMSSSGCRARIHIDKSVPPNPTVPPNPVVPPNPTRSIRPLATF